MARLVVNSAARPVTNSSAAGGGGKPHNPVTSPITLTTVGVHSVRVPLDVDSVHVAVWGGGGGGGTSPVTAPSGAIGGNAAGYAACDLGGPLFTSGSKLLVTVGAGGDGSVGGAGGDSKVVCGSTTVATGHGGEDSLGFGGTGEVGVASGISGGVTVTGANGGSNTSTDGGKGGAPGGTGAGVGGAGGASGKAGSPGTQPGAGGGGAGKHGLDGGDGGAGKVVITWA